MVSQITQSTIKTSPLKNMRKDTNPDVLVLELYRKF